MTQKLLFCVLLVAGCLADNFSGNPANHPKTETHNVCPDCGEEHCIYQDINNNVEGESDTDIYNAVDKICRQRGITDSATIKLILANYYL